MEIRLDDLSGEAIAAFLDEHIRDMRATSPPESKHALDLDGLRQPAITFWIVWDGDVIAGCGALKELDRGHGEVKSMRTAVAYRGQGVASLLLEHIISEAQRRGYERLSLETGSMPFFAPARRLYARFGFAPCGPFAGYTTDPNSAFMTKGLAPNTKRSLSMFSDYLVKIFEHNNWANDQIIQACTALNDEQLDAQPQSATKGTIRQTLIHLVGAQQFYLDILTMPLEERTRVNLDFADVQEASRRTGTALLALARNETSSPLPDQLQTNNGYLVAPWVLMVQAINHATEHREQINSMLSTLKVTPPELDGWSYGEVMAVLRPAA